MLCLFWGRSKVPPYFVGFAQILRSIKQHKGSLNKNVDAEWGISQGFGKCPNSFEGFLDNISRLVTFSYIFHLLGLAFICHSQKGKTRQNSHDKESGNKQSRQKRQDKIVQMPRFLFKNFLHPIYQDFGFKEIYYVCCNFQKAQVTVNMTSMKGRERCNVIIVW